MSLWSRITEVLALIGGDVKRLEEGTSDLAVAVGVDVRNLRERITAVEGGSSSPVPHLNAATRLIQTQRVILRQVAKGKL